MTTPYDRAWYVRRLVIIAAAAILMLPALWGWVEAAVR